MTEQVEVERVGEAAKAEAEAIEALPKVERRSAEGREDGRKPSKTPKDYAPRLKAIMRPHRQGDDREVRLQEPS